MTTTQTNSHSANNITGENLMDIDQTVLKEMGVKKVGDRVRIGSQAKLFRHKEYRQKRNSNRVSHCHLTVSLPTAKQEQTQDSFNALTHQNQNPTPPSSASPHPPRSARSQSTPREQKRFSVVPAGAESGVNGIFRPTAVQQVTTRNISRPASPMYVDNEPRNQRARYPTQSPREKERSGQEQGNYGKTSLTGTAATVKTRGPHLDTAQASQYSKSGPPSDTPKTARFPAPPPTNSSHLPQHQSLIRAIFENGRTSVISVEGCRSAEDIQIRTGRKAGLTDVQARNHRFYLLDGTEANYARTRRLSETDLMRICSDKNRPERERLIYRDVTSGEPEGPQLLAAADIASEQARQAANPTALVGYGKSLSKIQKLTGESLPSLSYPMSPASVARREQHLQSTAQELENPEPRNSQPRSRPRRADSFSGGRPESEYVVADPETYFPDVKKDEIEKTVRMSIRRSQRISRANSRLSTASRMSMASNFSVNSSQGQDVPAVPAIPAAWQSGQHPPPRVRPLSIMGNSRPQSSFRDSIASSTIDAIDEESTYEPNRKSYVSFGADSAPDSATVSNSEHDSNSGEHSYFEEGSSPPLTEAGESLQDQIVQVLAEDGEDPDDELTDFMKKENWDNIKYIRGRLIGQGSFGCVYMALHQLTAELMAVKQVELPSTAGTAVDARKNNMVEALKREIALLRELKHENIVQYLGSSSDANNLNIFLEYVPGGSIAKMLVDYGSMEEHMVGKLVRQILVGLKYLHSKDIIHRDIKGANILVDSRGKVKISDFGISKRVQDSKTLLSEDANGSGSRGGGRGGFANQRVSLQGSVFWMAPEVVKQTAYTRKADIWSLGCLVVEMLTGSHPHPNCTQLQAIFKIGGKGAGGTFNDPSPDVPAKAGKDASDFLNKTFKIEHEQRPEAAELLNMAFVRARG